MNKAAFTAIVLLVAVAIWGAFSYRSRLLSIDASIEETGELLEQSKREASGNSYLTACAVCDGKISSTAEKCPHCGEAR